MLTTERPPWRDSVEHVMGQIAKILPSRPDDPAAVRRFAFLERITTLLLRFGTQRSDPIPSMLAHIGNYWSSGILMSLHAGPLRPSTLQKLMALQGPSRPISKRMLMINLRALEQDGLIERKVYASRRLHVEYQLTPLGEGLCAQLLAVIEWSAENLESIVQARAAQRSE